MKKLLSLLLLITLIFPPLIKADGEIEISSWTELANIGHDSSYPCRDASYILTRDLTSADADYVTIAGPEASFQPICNAGDDFSNSIFDGRNFEIQDLVINSAEGAALFSDLEGATIKNLVLRDIEVTADGYYVAGLARRMSGGTIENVYVSGTVTNGEGRECTGGLVGSIEETASISKSATSVSVTGSKYVGGLVGCSDEAAISQSYSDGDSISGGNYLGGLIGWAQSTTIRDTYSRSNLSATGQFVGGLVGLLGSEFMGSIYSSYATGDVTGWFTIGGLVGGINNDDIHDSFSTGEITLLDDGAWIGGVFGDYQNTWTIDNVYWYKSDHNSELTCYASGDCDGNDTAISTEQGSSYFYDASHEPMSGWNFTTIWLENENDYPTLRDMPGEDDDNEQSTPTPTPSNRRLSSKSAPACSDQKPSAPDLFQINTTLTNAKLYFTPLSSTNTYVISFSTNPSAEEHGEQVTLTREGVQSHQIYFLRPNTTYYLKVRGQNGCAAGEWSNIMKVKTDARIYYKNFSQASTSSALQQNSLINQGQTKAPVASQLEPSVKLAPTDAPTSTPAGNLGQVNTGSKEQNEKKCFLWWCW